MFENNFSLTNLPTWKSHKPAKQDIPQIFKFSNLCKSNDDEEILGKTTDDVNALRNDQFKDDDIDSQKDNTEESASTKTDRL